MNELYPRPGIYSRYGAVFHGIETSHTLAILAQGEEGASEQIRHLSYFNTDYGENSSLTKLLEVAFASGLTSIYAVHIPSDDAELYMSAVSELHATYGADLFVFGTLDRATQRTLAEAMEAYETLGFVGADSGVIQELRQHAAALNSSRMLLTAPAVASLDGLSSSGVYAAAALAAQICLMETPMASLEDLPLFGLTAPVVTLDDSQVNLLLRAGVTPVQPGTSGPVVPYAVTTCIDGSMGAVFGDLRVTLVKDCLMRTMRQYLSEAFAQHEILTQSEVRSKTEYILELFRTEGYIDTYDGLLVYPDGTDCRLCRVDFRFRVTSPMQSILLSAQVAV